MAETNKEFPKEVFLKLENETFGDSCFGHYLSAEDVAEPGKEIEVGIYRLYRIAKIKAPVSIEER